MNLVLSELRQIIEKQIRNEFVEKGEACLEDGQDSMLSCLIDEIEDLLDLVVCKIEQAVIISDFIKKTRNVD